MAGNRQQFTLQFNADTAQAKKAIQDLNNSLQNLQKAQSNSGFADLGINKAVESAKELSEHLNKALNVNTGKLNLSTFQNSLQASNTSLKSLTSDLLKAGTVGQQAFLAMAGAIAQAEVPLRQTNKTIKDFAQTLKNTVKWEISSTAVHGLESALSGAVSYVKGLNSSLNNIRIVTGQSAEDMAKFAEQANRAARELSTTTKAYADASLIYYQQGDSIEQAAQKAAITIKAANSSFNTTAAEMSEYLTAVWNSYQVGANELERYVDIMAALGAKTATSLEEIATSMQKVAATANTVGVSMEQVSSIIATVSSVTRESAESIGTAYKTIFARMGDLKLGKTLEDGVSLGQVSDTLAKIGVAVLDANGQMNDMGNIIESLMERWQNLTRAEQTAVAQVVAGKRQYTQLFALMENQQMYEKNMSIAKNADGSLDNMYKIQAESVEASSARMQAALENLYSKFINDQSIIQFTESITGVVDAITSVIDAFGGLPGILGNIGAIAIKVFSKDIAGGIDKTLAKLTTFTSQFTGKNTFTKVAKGIGATLTGRAQSVQQIEQQKAMTQARAAIEAQKQGVFNESGRFAVDEAAELLSYKERLLSIQHQLTDAQKEEAQAALNNLSQQQAEIIKLKADKEQMQKDEEDALRKEKQAILNEHSGTNALGGKFKSSQEKREHIETQMSLQYAEGSADGYYGNLTQQDINSMDAMLQKSKALGAELERTDQALEMIRSQLRSGDIKQTGVEFDELKAKIEKLLNQKLEATTLDDLRQELQEIGSQALLTQEQLNDLVKVTTDGIDETGVGKKFVEALNKSFERGQESASLDFELNIKTSSLAKAKQKIADAFNPKSATYSKISENMTKAASATGSFISGLSTGGNLLQTLTDESASLGDQLGSIAGGISTIVSGFASGGWIGMAVAMLGMVISMFEQAAKAAREAYEETLQKDAEYAKTKVSDNTAQFNAIKDTMAAYGEMAGSLDQATVTSAAFQTSVTNLTEALGVQKATVQGLVAEYGNLNNAINQNTITQLEETVKDFNTNKSRMLENAMVQGDKNNNIYYQNGNQDLFTIDTSSIETMLTTQKEAAAQIQLATTELDREDQQWQIVEQAIYDAAGKELSAWVARFMDSEKHSVDFEGMYKDLAYAMSIVQKTQVDEYGDLTESGEKQLQTYIDFIKTMNQYFIDPEAQINMGGWRNYDIYAGNHSWGSAGAAAARLIGSQHGNGGFSSGINDSWLSRMGGVDKDGKPVSNLDNFWKTDISKHWLDYVDTTANQAKENATIDAAVSDGNAFPAELQELLDQVSTMSTMTAEEAYEFYLKLTKLSETYPEIQQSATWQGLNDIFGNVFEGADEAAKQASTFLNLIEHGMGLDDLATKENLGQLDNLAELNTYLDEVYASMGGAESGLSVSEFRSQALELLQFWGIIPEVTKDLLNELSVSAGLASKYGVEQDDVLQAMSKITTSKAFQDSGLSAGDFAWGNLTYDKETGTFTDESFQKELAYQQKKSGALILSQSMSGIKELMGQNSEEIYNHGAGYLESLNINWEKVTGYDEIDTMTEWLTLDNDARQDYLMKLFTAQRERYLAENDGLQALIDADKARKQELEKTYQEYTATEAYKKAIEIASIAQKADKDIGTLLQTSKSDRSKISWDSLIGENGILTSLGVSQDTIAVTNMEQAFNDWVNGTDEDMFSLLMQQALSNYQSKNQESLGIVDFGNDMYDQLVGLDTSIRANEEQLNFEKLFPSIFGDTETEIDATINNVKKLNQEMTALSDTSTLLNKIDIGDKLSKDTAEYTALSNALQDTSYSIEDYTKATNAKTKAEILSAAKVKQLQREQAKQAEIVAEYDKKQDGTSYGFASYTTEQIDALYTDQTKADELADYENWLAAVRRQNEISQEISAEEAQLIQDKITIGASISKAAVAQLQAKREELMQAAEAMNEAATVLSEHAQDGVLSLVELSKLTEAQQIAWASADSHMDRVVVAAQETQKAYASQAKIQRAQNENIAAASKTFAGTWTDTPISELDRFATLEGYQDWISNLDSGTQEALTTAYSNISSQISADTTAAQWKSMMTAELAQMGEDGAKALQTILNEGQNTIIETYATLGAEEAKLAQSVLEEWRNTFEQISNLRKQLIAGEDIGETLASSLENYVKIFDAWNNTNKETLSLLDAYKNGSLKYSDFDTEDFTVQLKLQLASMGLQDDIADNKDTKENEAEDYFDLFKKVNGKETLKSIDELAQEFSISKESFKDDQGNFNEKAYKQAVIEAASPFLKELLMNSGMSETVANEYLRQYLTNLGADGSAAITAINNAANKMTELTEEYTKLVQSNAKLAEVDAAYQAEKQEQEKIQAEKQAFAQVTDQIRDIAPKDRTTEAMESILSQAGISPESYIKAIQDMGYKDIKSLTDLSNMGSDTLRDIESTFEQDAVKAGQAIITAGEIFKAIVTGKEGEAVDLSQYGVTDISKPLENFGGYTIDEGLGYGEDSVPVKNINEEINTATENLNTFQNDLSVQHAEDLDSIANSVEMTTEEFKEFTKAMKEAGHITARTTEGQYEQARSLARIQKGLKAANTNMKNWTKSLKTNAKDVGACAKILGEMRGTFEDILDMPTGALDDLSEDFMTSADTAKLLEGALDGDVDAYNKLQAAVAKEFAIGEGATVSPDIENAINTIATEMDKLPVNEPIMLGELAQISPNLYSALTSYVAAIAAAGGDVQAAAAALGFDVKQVTKTFPYTVDGPQYTPGTSFTDPATGITYQSVNTSIDRTAGTITVTAIEAITNKGTHGGGISGSTPSGGGGGGGDKKPKKLDKKKPEDHKKRYFQIDNGLERMADALDKVDKIKKRAFGESYLKNLEAEISLIEQEIGLQEEYVRQAQEWLAVDKQRVASLGATFDGEGNISNYDALMDSILAKYNAFIDKYNAADAEAQENMEEEKEKMDEWFDEAIEWIDQYQETLNLIGDKQNEILELQNQISEKTLEKIQYKVEYKVEINEAEKDYLDYINDKYDEVLEKQDLLMDNYIRQGQIAEQNLSYLATARQELEAAFAAGDLKQADYVAGLQEIQSQILENLEAIQEAKKLIEELYGKTLDLASEELDKHTAKIDAASEAMGSYMSILQLMGKGQTFEDLLFFYEKQYDYNMASLESQMSYLNVLKEEEQYYLARMNSAEGLTETERIQYEALQETMNEVQANILSKTEETLQALKDMYDTTIEDIMKDLEESMVGVGNDLAWLTEEYGFYMEEMEQYVSSQRELYEISKLNRNIQQSINDTTSSVHKKQLKALQDEINAQSELKELSEYEIEMMNLKYELLLKQIALEEAQNAKSTVRLTRDSEGNMVYQYTADQDAINQAQQEYEDVLQQMADTNWEYEQDIYNQTLQLRQDTLEAIKEIAMDETLTEEQKQQRINEILDHYYERSRYLQEQYNIVSENTMATNELIADHYGIAVEEITDRTKGTVAEIIGEMINDTDNYRTEMEDAYERIRDAMEEYAQKIAEVTELTNTSYGSMIDSVENYDKVTEDAKNETAKMTKTLEEEVRQIHTTTTAWDNYYKTLGTVIDQYEAMYQAIQKTIKAQAQLAGATAPSSVNVNTSGTSSNSGNTSNSNSNSSNSNSSGNNNKPTGTSYTPYKSWQVALSKDGGKTWTSMKNVTSDASTVSGPATALYGAWQTGWQIKYRRYFETGWGNTYHHYKYENGGLADFTGPAWLDGTKSKPELVLNAQDTQNMFKTIDAVRQLDKSTLSMMDEFINLATSSMMANLFNIHAGTTSGAKDSEIEQNVHITAEFPNVQDSNEIQDAFDNLINRAAQYIGSKR